MTPATRALFSLDGRVALVSGGNSGIGRAIAGALADCGAAKARRSIYIHRNRSKFATNSSNKYLRPGGFRTFRLKADHLSFTSEKT